MPIDDFLTKVEAAPAFSIPYTPSDVVAWSLDKVVSTLTLKDLVQFKQIFHIFDTFL